MYHVKPDKRSRSSAEAVSASLTRCLETKRYREIIVADILQDSGVGRATFYRLFDGLEDVLAYQCDSLMDSIIQGNCRITTEIFLSEIMRNDRLLEALIDSRTVISLFEAVARGVREHPECFDGTEGLDDLSTEYLAAVIAGTLIGTQMVWLRHDRSESLEALHVHAADSVDRMCRLVHGMDSDHEEK